MNDAPFTYEILTVEVNVGGVPVCAAQLVNCIEELLRFQSVIGRTSRTPDLTLNRSSSLRRSP